MSSTIARPYAKAAFKVATEAQQLPLWSLALKNLSIIVQDEKIRGLMKNPTVAQHQVTGILIDVLHKTTGNHSAHSLAPLENFIHLLAEKKRLSLLPYIDQLFEEDIAKAEGSLALTVTSAYPMNDAEKNTVAEKLAKQLKSKLHIEYNMNESIVGGLLVCSKDWVLDGTITGQIKRLKSALL